MTYFPQITIGYADTPAIDAFNRLRVSNVESVFSAQQQYNNATIQFEAGNTGTGVAPSYDANSRMSTLSATAGSGTSFMQSYQYSPYEPGRSQLVFITGVMGTAVAGAVKDIGYFDANNGVIFRQNGTSGLQIGLRTSTSGSPVDTFINQSSWNVDKFDGTGASGVNLDATKDFILVIDLQYLGMGRVRVGFDVGGIIYYAHQFLAANVISLPYMQSATLPIGILLTATATATTASMNFKCASVMSEGGSLDSNGYDFASGETTATAGSGTRVPLQSIRPKTTFNSVPNRELFILRAINLAVTGTNPVYWELVVGGAYGGQAFSDVNTTYSAFEYSSTPGTFTNLTGGIVISAGYAPQAVVGGNAEIGIAHINIPDLASLRYPVSLDRSGAVRALGTMTLLVTGIGGTSACRGSFDFREIR